MTAEVVRLPVPERLEPKSANRTLMVNVRSYFYTLYNASGDQFRKLLVSVGNKDAITGNRLFDRYQAVDMIKNAAAKAEDEITVNAKHGDVYFCLSRLMRQHDMGLKLRRQEFARLTHRAAAE